MHRCLCCLVIEQLCHCSQLKVDNPNSTSGHVVVASDFMYGTYMQIHPPCLPIRYLAYMTYMNDLVGIYIPATYLVISHEVAVALFWHICAEVLGFYGHI